MKLIISIFVIFFFLSICAGFVGLRYPIIVKNEPFKKPTKVLEVNGQELTLENGKVIYIKDFSSEEIIKDLKYSNYTIQVENVDPTQIIVYIRREGGVCGTPWAAPIRIPIFGQTVYRDRISTWALAKEKNREQEDQL
jgi:hypothetical protein